MTERQRQGLPYEKVILVGYSAGSLLLRKAMVWGLGQIDDHPDQDAATANRWSWAFNSTAGKLSGRIERIVLIAGMNRGWSLEERPRDMPLSHFIVYRCVLLLMRLCLRPIGRFMFALERGEPFVADLRVQWLRLGELCREHSANIPPTMQLLGTVDDLVARDDNKDVLALEGSDIRLVPHSDHFSILTLDKTDSGACRRKLLVEALRGEVPSEDTPEAYQVQALADRKLRQATKAEVRSADRGGTADVPMIVFLVHGIRANSDWGYEVRRIILRHCPKALCFCSSYGFLSMGQFLATPVRRRRVRWFMDQYTEALAHVGSSKISIHFIGHSNGTYILAQSLVNYKTPRFDRVILTGSVVERHFPWDRYGQEMRVCKLRNERASGDWVVGIFPGFYQLLGKIVPFGRELPVVGSMFDIGDGGFRGFDRPAGLDHEEIFYLPGGHGAGVEKENQEHLMNFILDRPSARSDLLQEPGVIVLYLSNLCWLMWLFLFIAFVVMPLYYLDTFYGCLLVAVFTCVLLTV